MQTKLECITSEDKEVLEAAILDAIEDEREFVTRLMRGREGLPPGVIHEASFFIARSEDLIRSLERLRKTVISAPLCVQTLRFGVQPPQG